MKLQMKREKQMPIQGARWRRLDNTGKLFAAVTGESLGNVFRLSAVLTEEISPDQLLAALNQTLKEYENFRVRLRKGFFWDYFETNNREPLVEPEEGIPCKYIDPHDGRSFPFRVSFYKKRINLEVFHGLTDGLGAMNFMKALTEHYLALSIQNEQRQKEAASVLSGFSEANGLQALVEAESGERKQLSQPEKVAGKAQPEKQAEEAQSKAQAEKQPEEVQSKAQAEKQPEKVLGEAQVKKQAEKAAGKARAEKQSEKVAGEAQAEKQPEKVLSEAQVEKREENEQGMPDLDGYLKNYKKRPARRYRAKRALAIRGACLPLDVQSVIQGTLSLSELKEKSRFYGVSMTKYLAAVLIWSLIQIYSDGKTVKRPAALNLPVNLRGIFDTETLSNFFSITNLYWPAGAAPSCFEEVLELVSRQMDEQTAKERLEETISYNVSNEKKWYLRIIPRALKHKALAFLFRRSSRAHTMTLSNVGQVVLKPEYQERVEQVQAMIGVSSRQRMKCAFVTSKEQVMITFTSVMTDSRLQDYFFRFLEKQGFYVHLESNGAVRPDLDEGNYPHLEYDSRTLKRFSRLFYLVLFTMAVLTGVVNLATYRWMPLCWSFMTIGAVAYVALIVRYSIMRKASLAGDLVRHSAGLQAMLILFDAVNGFSGWSVNYVIPSLILFDVIAIVFLIIVNRLNWQGYFMYQIALTFFSFVPLVLWALGLVTRPMLSLATVILSVAVLAVTMLLGDRSVKDELKRRFHL